MGALWYRLAPARPGPIAVVRPLSRRPHLGWCCEPWRSGSLSIACGRHGARRGSWSLAWTHLEPPFPGVALAELWGPLLCPSLGSLGALP